MNNKNEFSYREALVQARNMLKRMNTKQKLLNHENFFNFDINKCISDCIGRCCINTPVMINVYDVYNILTSVRGKELGYGDTTKLFDGKNAPLILFLDENENMPSAMINLMQRGFNLDICPFAYASNKDTNILSLFNYYHETADKKLYRMPHLSCGIHEIKPTICRSSPLSRMLIAEDERSFEFFYINPPSSNCPAINTNKKWRLEEYIKKWDLERFYKNRDKITEIFELLVEKPIPFRRKIAKKLFNFDKDNIDQGLDPVKNRPSYEELFRTIIELIKK